MTGLGEASWSTHTSSNYASESEVRKVPKSGGYPEVLVSGETNPLVGASDETFVYWVEEIEGGRIRRVAK